jgi:hypothetical protein
LTSFMLDFKIYLLSGVYFLLDDVELPLYAKYY